MRPREMKMKKIVRSKLNPSDTLTIMKELMEGEVKQLEQFKSLIEPKTSWTQFNQP
jgi:hypothetical protein